MNDIYPKSAYIAARDVLTQTVERSILERDDYGFSTVWLAPTLSSQIARKAAVIWAFYAALPAAAKAEIISECFTPDMDFVERTMVYIGEYLEPVIAARLDEMTKDWLREQEENYFVHKSEEKGAA